MPLTAAFQLHTLADAEYRELLDQQILGQIQTHCAAKPARASAKPDRCAPASRPLPLASACPCWYGLKVSPWTSSRALATSGDTLHVWTPVMPVGRRQSFCIGGAVQASAAAFFAVHERVSARAQSDLGPHCPQALAPDPSPVSHLPLLFCRFEPYRQAGPRQADAGTLRGLQPYLAEKPKPRMKQCSAHRPGTAKCLGSVSSAAMSAATSVPVVHTLPAHRPVTAPQQATTDGTFPPSARRKLISHSDTTSAAQGHRQTQAPAWPALRQQLWAAG